MSNPRIIPQCTKSYDMLEAAAKILEATSKNYTMYSVKDVYFDYGQDWRWTTIIADTGSHTYQAINPRDWERIISAETVKDLCEAVEEVQNGKFFNDK